MNPFEKLFSPKKDDGLGENEHEPEVPDIQPNREIPLIPEIKHDRWEEKNPEGVREIIDSIDTEEEAERRREQIIDQIIEDRNRKKH